MRIIKDITEDEMVLTFIKGEASSVRFGGRMTEYLKESGFDRKIIDNPDLSNDSENHQRKVLLGKHRGYANNDGLFRKFPEKVDWKEVVLTKEDLEKVKYINYSYWVELSAGTRSPVVAAENVKDGLVVFSKSPKDFFKTAEYIKKGGKLNKLIFVCKNDRSPLVILEGHLRLTSYFLIPEYIPEELNCIVGFSEEFSNWGLY